MSSIFDSMMPTNAIVLSRSWQRVWFPSAFETRKLSVRHHYTLPSLLGPSYVPTAQCSWLNLTRSLLYDCRPLVSVYVFKKNKHPCKMVRFILISRAISSTQWPHKTIWAINFSISDYFIQRFRWPVAPSFRWSYGSSAPLVFWNGLYIFGNDCSNIILSSSTIPVPRKSFRIVICYFATGIVGYCRYGIVYGSFRVTRRDLTVISNWFWVAVYTSQLYDSVPNCKLNTWYHLVRIDIFLLTVLNLINWNHYFLRFILLSTYSISR